MACRLALKAAGRTSPNPMVGAVLVRGKRIVATGYHPFAGADHAEIVALKRAGAKARGATLYINLEPCSHQGRTPPCTDALIRAGIKEVVAGMKDPNPRVAGRGFARLRRAGIRVRSGLLGEECRTLNEAFVKFITRRLPFVTLKLAASLDGKIATASGDARWISGADSRAMVHRMRNHVDGVLVGSGTAIADDPQLTCRIRGGRNPWRIVVDGRLRIRPSARLFHQRDPGKTIVVTSTRAPAAKARALESRGAQVWRFPLCGGEISWMALLRGLADSRMLSVLIEGGATVAASALRAKIVDKVIFFYAPKILGGDGRVMIDSLGIRRVDRLLRIRRLAFRKSGEDLLVTGYL
ncbi:MAG: bifunctional diaminohydroxyphosphoribosylaminopyrimidine deaminase/5-amino-6-(5-phosphoribosylamino)uracil reductase RibD [Deltaproteobacteria bacterium]|nr:bifunctional diaminohydroxyphosphoribosylaminopyrimidine deaminase/5-amino-6-(5-phosphoribosylamino)uracil reductase RibD [Deltaproteobacteria bacterium]MBI2534011.1 bifunctional diaminohydroxyphosphoribosylaminopyrimidine deaminase/5-amino-6-(5-phosphoribosylamino)uracil reductase RibD [Deltaproteobacteria bacterium]